MRTSCHFVETKTTLSLLWGSTEVTCKGLLLNMCELLAFTTLEKKTCQGIIRVKSSLLFTKPKPLYWRGWRQTQNNTIILWGLYDSLKIIHYNMTKHKVLFFLHQHRWRLYLKPTADWIVQDVFFKMPCLI